MVGSPLWADSASCLHIFLFDGRKAALFKPAAAGRKATTLRPTSRCVDFAGIGRQGYRI